MAVTRSVLEKEAWNAPAWPNRLPPADTLTVLYGENADELVIRFPSAPARDIVVVFIDTPDIDYAGMLVRMDTGDVVGVYVNYLAIYAVSQHPTWHSMTNRCPNPADAHLVVADIKELFERYGIGDHVDSKRA
jgi:hypothetical protein